MNQDRIRIYELSKELNLNNQELLALCARLNIAARSHSSTISQFDANHLRLMAKKQAKSAGSDKQEILGIRKSKGSERTKLEQSVSPSPKSTVGSAVVSPPPSASSRKLTTPNRSRGKPELANPPVKPTPSVASKPRKTQEKPATPRRDQIEQAHHKSLEITQKNLAEKRVRPTSDKQSDVQKRKERESVTTQPLPELRRPKPARSVESETPAYSLLPKPIRVTAEPKELLERPKPSRLYKKGKKRQQAEIHEEREPKAKVSKAGTRIKHQLQLVELSSEEDWETAKLPRDAAIPASLAMERPPKRPASKSPARVSSTATAAKIKHHHEAKGARHLSQELKPKRERPEKLVVTGSMTVSELAEALAVRDTEIVKILFIKGMAINITQNLDIPTITLVGEELGVSIEKVEPKAEATQVTEMLDVEDLENLQPRPPVVTIMGHVDHGKTSLLDGIRHSKVAQGEAGGITQHIGAYSVDVELDGQTKQVVFLDTPGHEAFTAMRARGTRVTDIAVLVVAADDGVQPQTVEAINHAQAAQVPIVVAINKIDKLEAQPERVKQELSEYGLMPEEWGGDTIMVPVSAVQRENLDELLEMILLVAEVSDLQANPNRPAKGTVIEANLDKTRGAVATLLVQNGTLRVGDILVAGSSFGKVRTMVNDRGRRVKVATPSLAVEISGLSNVPAAGDEFSVFQDEKEARAIAATRVKQKRLARLTQGGISLTTLSAQAQQGELKELNLILKADVRGSVEAIVEALKQLPQDEVQLRLLLAAPGEITETDIDLAAASDAVIIGFNTTLVSGAREAADAVGVDVREYNIIYQLLEDIQGAMEGLLEPELVEQELGTAQVRAVFPVGRGKVAGCYIQSGKVVRNCKLRVHRGGQVIYEGNLDSLKRLKDDVKEVNAGYECGIGIAHFNNWVVGDIIEAFHMVTKRRTLAVAK
ncbi:MAG: translation initiation factor IF-2 [Xenococcaceae cyanobacterium MO_167.B27]|nr:translation initiation factor IF-2 [Xenococcaceae cyanobacterium MO_167.B27]